MFHALCFMFYASCFTSYALCQLHHLTSFLPRVSARSKSHATLSNCLAVFGCHVGSNKRCRLFLLLPYHHLGSSILTSLCLRCTHMAVFSSLAAETIQQIFANFKDDEDTLLKCMTVSKQIRSCAGILFYKSITVFMLNEDLYPFQRFIEWTQKEKDWAKVVKEVTLAGGAFPSGADSDTGNHYVTLHLLFIILNNLPSLHSLHLDALHWIACPSCPACTSTKKFPLLRVITASFMNLATTSPTIFDLAAFGSEDLQLALAGCYSNFKDERISHLPPRRPITLSTLHLVHITFLADYHIPLLAPGITKIVLARVDIHNRDWVRALLTQHGGTIRTFEFQYGYKNGKSFYHCFYTAVFTSTVR